MKHAITESSGGNGWTIWSDAICTCGWRGRRLWGFNNPEWCDFKREQSEHLFESGKFAAQVAAQPSPTETPTQEAKP